MTILFVRYVLSQRILAVVVAFLLDEYFQNEPMLMLIVYQNEPMFMSLMAVMSKLIVYQNEQMFIYKCSKWW